jgi:hypothetical protein
MRRLGWGSIALGLGVAAASLLGPLVTGTIDYHVVADVLNQVKGGDAAALLLVAPVAVAAGILALRGHPAAPVLALAPAGFALYTYTQLALGGEFALVPGNSERFFLLFLALFVLGGGVFAAAWRASALVELPEPSRRFSKVLVGVLLGVAAFLTLGLHLPGLVDVLGGPPYAVDYTQSPAVFWIVKLMDLGIVVPVSIATAVGILLHARWARLATYAMVGWGALLASSVAGMAVVMQVNDDPAASPANTIVFGLFAAAFLALAFVLYSGLFGRAPVSLDRVPEQALAAAGRR